MFKIYRTVILPEYELELKLVEEFNAGLNEGKYRSNQLQGALTMAYNHIDEQDKHVADLETIVKAYQIQIREFKEKEAVAQGHTTWEENNQ